MDDELRQAAAEAFGIEPAFVAILDNITDLRQPFDERSQVIIDRRPTRGDFTLHLAFYLRDASLAAQVNTQPKSLSKVQDLAQRLHSDLVMSDDSPDPSTWLLVQSTGAVRPVLLDDERFEENTYVVLANRQAS